MLSGFPFAWRIGLRLKSRGWAKKKSGKLVDDAGVCRRITRQTPRLAILRALMLITELGATNLDRHQCRQSKNEGPADFSLSTINQR